MFLMIAPTGGCVAVRHALLCLCSPLAPLVSRQRLRQTKEIQQLEQFQLPSGLAFIVPLQSQEKEVVLSLKVNS